MTAERRPVSDSRIHPDTTTADICRCALCRALLDAAVRAERLRLERRATLQPMNGGKR